MLMIWYNPELDTYEKGDLNQFEVLRKNSSLQDSFKKVFEFNPTSERLIDQVFFALTANKKKFSPATCS
jgi:hypothetical protein